MNLRGLQFWAFEDMGWTLRGTVIDDMGGGGTTTYVPGGTIPCRIDPLTRAGDERVVGGRLDDRSTHRVTTIAGADVRNTDRFAITSGTVYEVTAVHKRTSELTKVFEVVEA
jgi:hypothetical protein